MPSPFPGMDPYLEHPVIFPDFHDGFIVALRELLQRSLPEPYYAALGRRAWVEVSERYIGPDVGVTGLPPAAPSSPPATHTLTADEPTVVHVPHDERVETGIEIYVGRHSDRRLVTALEVLSPSNKTKGEQGRELYLRKQREVLQSKTHLVEIDLLRGGEHTTAVPRDRFQQQVSRSDYHVCVHRFDNLEDYFVYALSLTQPLPTIGVPLLPGDDDVALDLQAAFQRTYDAGPYQREINYQTDEVIPPLTAEQTDWAKQELARHARS